jgi:hypothetical protein
MGPATLEAIGLNPSPGKSNKIEKYLKENEIPDS